VDYPQKSGLMVIALWPDRKGAANMELVRRVVLKAKKSMPMSITLMA